MARNNPIVWRATAISLCPICGGKDACSATQDDLYFCWRTHHDTPEWVHFKDTANGFGILRSLGGSSTSAPRPSHNGHRPTKEANGRLKAELPAQAILDAAKAGPDECSRLANMLGVSTASLQQLGIGYEPETGERDPEHWLFPERDCIGKVIGLTRRYAAGRKLQLPGSKRGLTFNPSRSWPETVLVPEGASDVAAALAMELSAVGRPNNLGGVELLRELLWPAKKAGSLIVIMAERDQKPNGTWPGMEGATRTAQRLADAWGEPVAYALPGDEQKDVRSWLVSRKIDPNNATAMKRLGRKFLAEVRERLLICAPRADVKMGNCEDDLHDTLKDGIYPKCIVQISSQLTSPEQENTGGDFGPASREVIRQGTFRRPCPYSGVPVLQKLANPHHGALLSVACRQHACRCCGPRLRSLWLTHVTCKILDTAAPLYFWNGQSSTEWKTARNRLRYRKASYVASHRADGIITVISTIPLNDDPEIEPFAAAERFAEALLNLARRRKPINTSKDWRRSDEEVKSRQYRRVGSAPEGSFDKAVRQLQADDIEPMVSETARGEKCVFVLPEDWPEERTTPYLAGLGWGVEPGPPSDESPF